MTEFANAESESTEDFFHAVTSGDIVRVRELLEKHPDLVHAYLSGMQPVVVAAYHGQKEVVELLLSRGAGVDLFLAAVLNDTDRLAALLVEDRGMIDAYSVDGWTALHLAAHFGSTEAARILLHYDANLQALSSNRNHNTPLHAALAGRREDTASFLVHEGADVNATDGSGWRPIHLAAQNGSLEAVKMLLENGADVNVASNQGETPDVTATRSGHMEIAELIRRVRTSGFSTYRAPSA